MISIHAPLAGSDFYFQMHLRFHSISIHAPLAGSDYPCERHNWGSNRFQSTLPLRGATHPPCLFASRRRNFNPRSPCGERLQHLRGVILDKISIHAPLAGSDDGVSGHLRRRREFQSTLPLRGATLVYIFKADDVGISIHAPLAGSDTAPTAAL